jgi:uncharacterized protein
MRLDDIRRSENFEDRRGIRLGRGTAIGGGTAVVALVLALLGAPKEVVQRVLQGGGQGSAEETAGPIDPAQEPLKDRALAVMATTEDTWNGLFRQQGRSYAEPKIIFFTEAVRSACGIAGSAVGPFYCPGDRQVYIDLSFFDELDRRFGAPGDFAQAYVIAHEVGHHVQTLTGLSEKVHAARARASEAQANALSVRQELQADCYAGVWAHHANKRERLLEAGDIEEGLRAATAIGDDTLQKRARGYVVPESFTHGSSAQRVQWFKRGWERGDPAACDTFKASI